MSKLPNSPKRYEDYTVAVICAIGFEMSAIRYMLDHDHPHLPPRREDSNMYVLGELSGHNVVLAWLPGNQGKGAAAIVATNLARTFPSIKWRFLVGIGGGVPSDKHDIRLGDVVISMPEGQYGGVVQYDLGKDTEDGFHLKGFLCPPPATLRNAVYMMQSDHLTKENKVDEFLSVMVQKGPKLVIYQRPPAGYDVLFEVDYPHVASRPECENCDAMKTISRRPRQFAGPEIHYGLIASGDRVMRSAIERNVTAGNVGDILCFEMEAAGIATEFPCIVIRGISDYADSHKNDSWQHYAAAAAAASAKELLSYINLEQPSVDAATARLGQGAPPSRNEPVTQQLYGQGIQSSGPFSVGGNLQIEYINKTIPLSNPIDDLWREFLEDLCQSDPSTDMFRIQDDKGGLLQNCFDWILDDKQLKSWQESENTKLLWVKGDPGKGKTMLMIGLVHHLRDRMRSGENCALAFFFCQNADPRLNNGISVLRGLIWMLLSKNLTLGKHIPEEYRLKSKEKRKAMFESQNPNLFSTLSTMLEDMLRDAPFDAVYILVDALDECDKDSDRLVRWMTQVAGNSQSKAKWLVSSRSSLTLDRTLHPNQHQQKLALELNDEHISRAVTRFIEHKVGNLSEKGKYTEELRREVQTKLEKKAESTFLWVALVCQRLSRVSLLKVAAEIDNFPPGLPTVYDRMMHLIDIDDISMLCKQVLRTVTIAYRPLTLEELIPLAELHGWQTHDVCELVSLCSSFVILRENTIRFLHQSAKDYLEKNYTSRLQPAGVTQGHADISRRSIDAMSSILKQNIYDLTFGFKPKKMRPPDPDPLAPIRYSCVFWADHHCFQNGKSPEYQRELTDEAAMFRFLKEHLLHWLECLSLLGKLSKGVTSLRKLLHAAQSQPDKSPRLLGFLKDAEKFVLSHGSIIERAPLQTYGSALVFSPTMSEVRNEQWKERLSFITNVKSIRDYWSAHQQTLEGHSGTVYSVAFSPDGTTLASASSDRTVRVWDTATGAHKQTLNGHSDWVSSVAFSPDGTTLASASGDRTVRVWDTATGANKQTLKGHSNTVHSVAFSPDGTALASASSDRTVRLWDTTTGAHKQILKGHSNTVHSVAFSPDGTALASASSDRTVRLWDTTTGAHKQTLKGHSNTVQSVAFSLDGTTLASASGDRTVRVWDTATGAHKQTLNGHSDWVSSVAFSPDGTTLASASSDETVRLWDTTTGANKQTLKGHSNTVHSVAFSPDGTTLASASSDRTVRVWDTATGAHKQTLKGHSDRVSSVAFSPDGTALASASSDRTVRLWDTATGAHRQTLKGHSDRVSSVAFSPDGTTLASASGDETVRLWDTTTGAHKQTLNGHSNTVYSVAFSPDGTTLASASSDRTVRVWDTATGAHKQTLNGHSDWVSSVAFSPDGTTLASASGDETVRLWDTTTGAHKQTLKGHSDWVSSVAFSPDGTMLASASGDETVRLWDAATNAHKQTLKVNFAISHFYFSSDRSCLHTDRGVLKITCGTASPSLPSVTLAVLVKEQWIVCGSKTLLWLPPDYRATSVAVFEGIVVLGHASGRISIIEFIIDSKY